MIVRFFTETVGMVATVARNARRSAKRFGALEPMHLLQVEIDCSPVRELGTLTEARIERARIGLTSRLATMEAAGQALRWLRRAAPNRSAEPQLWYEVNMLLDRLDHLAVAQDAVHDRAHDRVHDGSQDNETATLLAATGLRLLSASGWGLELECCVRCRKPCPERSRSILDVAAGGIVCRDCGGRGDVLSAAERLAFLDSAAGTGTSLNPFARRVIDFVEQAFEIHGRGDAT